MSQIFHREMGSGKALVLVHGFCETNQIWERFTENLSDQYRVLTPDLPGFGESALPPTPFTIDDIGARLLNWMDQLQLELPVVVGHSLGGYVALAMAARQPDRFPGFGLFHSTSFADSVEKKENRNRVIDFVRRNGVQPYIDTFVPGLFFRKNNPYIGRVHEIASQTPRETLIAYAEAMRDRPSSENIVATFSKPILMIVGEQDTVLPYEPSVLQTNLMQFPFFCGLTGVGHMGMFENEPESLKIVRQFLNQTFEVQ